MNKDSPVAKCSQTVRNPGGKQVEQQVAQDVVGKGAKRGTKVLKASKQAKKWLGKGSRVIINRSGDKIFMSKDGLRKMRFDINNPHGYAPHVQLEILKNG